MELFARRIIFISMLILILSIFDFLDDEIIRIFSFKDEGIFELIVDAISPIIEVCLLFWALLTGKKIMNHIQEEEQQYKRLVELSPAAIIIHNRDQILYVNKSGVHLFGASTTSELLNRKMSDFVHSDSKDSINTLKQHLDKFPNSMTNQQIKIKRIDGVIIDLEFKSTKIEFKGQSARELIARDITIQKHKMDDVKKLAYQDALTGLPNRRAFMDQFTQALKVSEKNNSKFGVMFIDLDGFKQINDTLGHDGGDLLLKEVSQYFTKSVAQKGIVARLAGDEFIVLLKEVDHDDCETVAQKIIESLSSPITILGKKVRVTPSIGIALNSDHSQDATELIKNADMAMYQAKQQGKNNYQIFTPENSHLSNIF